MNKTVMVKKYWLSMLVSPGYAKKGSVQHRMSYAQRMGRDEDLVHTPYLPRKHPIWKADVHVPFNIKWPNPVEATKKTDQRPTKLGEVLVLGRISRADATAMAEQKKMKAQARMQ